MVGWKNRFWKSSVNKTLIYLLVPKKLQNSFFKRLEKAKACLHLHIPIHLLQLSITSLVSNLSLVTYRFASSNYKIKFLNLYINLFMTTTSFIISIDTEKNYQLKGQFFLPPNIYMFKINNRNIRKRCETCLYLTIKTPERHLSFWCFYR